MIIKRHTRKDIEINEIKELINHIKKIIKRLKRSNDQNIELLTYILNSTYKSPEEFKRDMLEKWKKGYKNLEFFGLNSEELKEEIQKRKDIKKKALQTALKNTGLTEKEYRRTLSNMCVEYWEKKGYSPEEAILKVKEIQSYNSKKASNQSKRESSPRTLDYWIKKGVNNPEERRSLWQRESSMRCVEYWLNRGCDLDEAKQFVSEIQRKSARFYYDNTPEAEIRANNARCPEYYRAKGMSEEEIQQQLKDNGRTFSLEICIRKYGEEEGYFIWKERQDRWQKTLNSKSPEELAIIREKQGRMSGRDWGTLGIPGLFYIIQISENKVKIGITTREIDKRYKPIDLKDKRIEIFKFSDIAEAYKIEQSIKINHLEEISKYDYGVFGWTEVLSSPFDHILHETTLLLNNKITS